MYLCAIHIQYINIYIYYTYTNTIYTELSFPFPLQQTIYIFLKTTLITVTTSFIILATKSLRWLILFPLFPYRISNNYRCHYYCHYEYLSHYSTDHYVISCLVSSMSITCLRGKGKNVYVCVVKIERRKNEMGIRE